MEHIGQPVDDGVEIGLSRENLAQMTGTTCVFRKPAAFGMAIARDSKAWPVRLQRFADVPSLRAIAKGDEIAVLRATCFGPEALHQKGFRSHG